MFKKATKATVFLKLAVTGPTGSGKTYGALRLARGLVGESGRIAFADTENGSASLYSDKFDFDVLDLAPPYEAQKFVDAIAAASKAGYDAIIIDSASHLWEGVLEYKSKLDSRPGANSYTNWNQAGEKLKAAISAALQSPIHVICCMRSKMEYVLETNERGKSTPRKVGLAPIMRDGIEYEFTTVFDVDAAHQAATSKDRTGLFGDRIFQLTEDTGRALDLWRKGDRTAAEPATKPAGSEPPALLTREQADKLAYYAKATAKTDAALSKAAGWASSGRVSTVAALTAEEADKLIAEFQRQMNKTAEQPVAAPAPSAEFAAPPAAPAPAEDVPYEFPSDLAFLEPKKAAALSYLVKLGWMQAGEGFDKLPAERIKQIVSRRANFERNVDNHAATNGGAL